MPVFSCGRSVPLPTVLEPIAHLSGGQSRSVRELPLLSGVRVGVLEIPLTQEAPRPLLEAVRLLFAVPDGARERELLADAVLVDRPQRPAAELLGLEVVRFKPHGLQLSVRIFGEAVRFDDVVQLAVVAHVIGHQGPGSEDRFRLVQLGDVGMGDGQGPEEASEPFDVSGLFKRLANGRHLTDGEVERRKRGRRRGSSGAAPASVRRRRRRRLRLRR